MKIGTRVPISEESGSSFLQRVLLPHMEKDPLAGLDERLSRLFPLCEEDEQDFSELDERSSALKDEIAKLEELYCPEAPRTQEMITLESKLERARLRLMTVQYQRLYWVKEIEEERRIEEKRKERDSECEPGTGSPGNRKEVDQRNLDLTISGLDSSLGNQNPGCLVPEIARNDHPAGELDADTAGDEEAGDDLGLQQRPVLQYILPSNEGDSEMKGYLIKAPEAMLDRWREAAQRRKMPASQMIREAVNRDIDAWENSVKEFSPDCKGAIHHVAGELCRRCGGSR